MSQTITVPCSSCGHPNDPSRATCELCGQPLNMTRFATAAPPVNPTQYTLLPLSSGAAGPAGFSPAVQQPQELVMLDAMGNEDQARKIDLTLIPRGERRTMGWDRFSQGIFVQIKLPQLFPELQVNTNEVAVSADTGAFRIDDAGHVFMSCGLRASSQMWVHLPGGSPRRILPGDEAFLVPGMFAFLGKNNSGITLVVR